MPLLGLLALFILVPIAELYLIFKVGDSIGILWTVLLLAADSVLGAVLLRSQGRTAWRRFSETLASGRMPHREVQDGVAVIAGGAFLLTPGFLTDAFGLALLLPPTRALVLRLVRRRLASRIATRVATGAGASQTGAGASQARPRPPDYDVEGTASEQPVPPSPRLER